MKKLIIKSSHFPPLLPHQHHGLFSLLKRPTSLTPVSNYINHQSTSGKRHTQQTCYYTCLVTAHSISKHARPATSALSTGLSQRRRERRKPPVEGFSFGEGSLCLFRLIWKAQINFWLGSWPCVTVLSFFCNGIKMLVLGILTNSIQSSQRENKSPKREGGLQLSFGVGASLEPRPACLASQMSFGYLLGYCPYVLNLSEMRQC